MSTKIIHVCDGCGEKLGRASETYTLTLESGRFMDAAGSRDQNIKNLEFCRKCSDRIVTALEKIAGKESEEKA